MRCDPLARILSTGGRRHGRRASCPVLHARNARRWLRSRHTGQHDRDMEALCQDSSARRSSSRCRLVLLRGMGDAFAERTGGNQHGPRPDPHDNLSAIRLAFLLVTRPLVCASAIVVASPPKRAFGRHAFGVPYMAQLPSPGFECTALLRESFDGRAVGL